MLATCAVPTEPINTTNCTEITALKVLSSIYEPLHAYVALAICVFGTITNVLNVAVLTQKPLRSPTNTLLTCVALADCVTMLVYCVRVVYLNLLTSPLPDGYAHSQFAVYFILFEQATIIAAHTVSTIVLVQLAAFRCCMIYSVSRGTIGATHGNRVGQKAFISHETMVILGVMVACLFGAAMGLPFFLTYCISSSQLTGGSSNDSLSQMAYWFDARVEYRNMEYTHFLLYGCLVKLLASILIIALSAGILTAMQTAHQRYLHLSDKLNNERPTVNQPLGKDASANTFPLTGQDQRTSNCNEVTEGKEVRLKPYHSELEEEESVTHTKEIELHHLAAVTTDATPNSQPRQVASRRAPKATKRLARRSRQSQQVTIMLIIVMVSFVVTEAPQGVLNTLVAVKGTCFHTTVYIPLGELLDMAVLLSSSINFILYCTMSQHFRAHFTRLVCTSWQSVCLLKPASLVNALRRTERPVAGNGRDMTLSGGFLKTG